MITREVITKLLKQGRQTLKAAEQFDKSARVIITICDEIFYYPEQVWDLKNYNLPYLNEEINYLINLFERLTKLDKESSEFIELVTEVIPTTVGDIKKYINRKNKVIKLIREGLKNNLTDVVDRAKTNKKVLQLLKIVL